MMNEALKDFAQRQEELRKMFNPDERQWNYGR